VRMFQDMGLSVTRVVGNVTNQGLAGAGAYQPYTGVHPGTASRTERLAASWTFVASGPDDEKWPSTQVVGDSVLGKPTFGMSSTPVVRKEKRESPRKR
jgi:hypothetical protein